MTGSLWRLLSRTIANPSGRIGLLILALLTAFVLVGPWLLPDPNAMPDLMAGARAPGAGHPFGTDQLNRDILSRVVSGGRISLTISALAVALAILLGALVGGVAGLYGGWVDGALMRIVDGALAIPRLFLLLLLVAVWEQMPLGALILVLGATGWFGTSRIVRGEVLRLREAEFVAAARSLGAGPGRIIFRHLLPNVAGPLLVAATLGVGNVILLEAGLSFLGVGVRPPTPSWGGMILDARPLLTTAPWASIFPGLAIVVTVLAVNLIGDALRGALDPRSA
ncbi:MAG: ABC transporter permease [Gemmatimonadales bacterium]|jgi:peptide/nickel transport system permease protein|nr:MAG: ABC transporter permease [Gemmatimonadales bacterium]